MLQRISDFVKLWKSESGNTLKIFKALNDQALKQKVAEDHRDLARIAWHISTTLPEMGKYIDIEFTAIKENQPIPAKLVDIISGYEKTAIELLNGVESNWTDETLQKEDDLYGEVWKRGDTLQIMINHEIHHRGQMTVLMRQAGLNVPGIYGPSYEEWEKYGGKPPEV